MEPFRNPSLVETPLGLLERVSPRSVEIRFKPAVTIDVAGLATIFEVRKRVQGADAVSLLVVIPPDAEMEIAVLGTDQFARNDGTEGLIAMATVAQSSMNEMLSISSSPTSHRASRRRCSPTLRRRGHGWPSRGAAPVMGGRHDLPHAAIRFFGRATGPSGRLTVP